VTSSAFRPQRHTGATGRPVLGDVLLAPSLELEQAQYGNPSSYRVWHDPIFLVTLPKPQFLQPCPEISQFARPQETGSDDNDSERDRHGPEDPLIDFHVANVVRVHA
jgi:hypothetical protein